MKRALPGLSLLGGLASGTPSDGLLYAPAYAFLCIFLNLEPGSALCTKSTLMVRRRGLGHPGSTLGQAGMLQQALKTCTGLGIASDWPCST